MMRLLLRLAQSAAVQLAAGAGCCYGGSAPGGGGWPRQARIAPARCAAARSHCNHPAGVGVGALLVCADGHDAAAACSLHVRRRAVPAHRPAPTAPPLPPPRAVAAGAALPGRHSPCLAWNWMHRHTGEGTLKVKRPMAALGGRKWPVLGLMPRDSRRPRRCLPGRLRACIAAICAA